MKTEGKEQQETPILKETCELVIGDHKVEVRFPSRIGQQLQIEQNKAAITNGSYALLAMNSVGSSDRMLDMVDCLSHFLVLVDDLQGKLGIKGEVNVKDLDFRTVEPLVEQYNENYARFYNQFVNAEQRIGSTKVKLEAVKFDKPEEKEEEVKKDKNKT